MRIVHLVTALQPGGLERVVIDLVTEQIAAQHTVRVLCLESPGPLADDLRRRGVRVEPVTGASLASRAWALARECRSFNADVIHSHNPGPHLHAVLAARVGGAPAIVHTKHGRNYPDERRRRLINRVAARLSAVVVAVSEDAAAVAREIERVPAARVRVVRNGVDVDAFPAVAEPAAASRAVHVARLHPVKDQATLLRAVARVATSHPSFVLDVVGDGPERARVQALARDLRIERHVHFVGYQRDVLGYLTRAAFFVLSSLTEGLSMTIIEAMAAGLPVIATRVGGNPEAVEDGGTGLLVPPGDAGALAGAMTMLLSDPERRRHMGRAARVRVESMFNLRDVAAEYERIYRLAVKASNTESAPASKAASPIHL